MRATSIELDQKAGNRENAAENETGGDQNDEEFLSLPFDGDNVKSDKTCYQHNRVAEKVE